MSRKKKKRHSRENAAPEPGAHGPDAPDPAPAPTPLPRHVATAALATALCCLAVYILTLCPSVPGGDGAELITAAYRTAVPHPPGYPLFALLGKAATLLPLGSVAWRVNLLSACFSSLAAVFILLAAARWTRGIPAAVLSAGLFAFAPLVWRYSVVAEVFSLNNLFIAALVYLAVRYWQDGESWIPFAGAFLFGLGMTNHHSLLFYGLPLSAWILWLGRKRLWNWKPLLGLALLFAAGLLPYLYLPYAASLDRMSSWGKPGTLPGFLHHFLRRDFGTFNLGTPDLAGKADLSRALLAYGRQLLVELLYVGPALAVFGLVRAWRREKMGGFASVSAFAFAFYMIAFHARANLPIEQDFYADIHSRFWQQANLVVCLWAGAGFAALFAGARPRVMAAQCVLAALLIGCQAAVNWRGADQSRNTLFRRFGAAVLSELPEKALLVTRGDLWVNTVRYIQECEGLRKDVCLLDLEFMKSDWLKPMVEKHYPHIVIPAQAYRPDNLYTGRPEHYSLLQLFDANSGRVPIFVNRFRKQSELVWPGKYETLPSGLMLRLVKPGAPFDIRAFIEENDKALRDFKPDFDSVRIRPGSWESLVRESYINALDARNGHIANYADAHGNEPALLRLIASYQADLVRIAGGANPDFYRNLGIACFRLKQTDPSAEKDMVRAWSRFLELAPPGDPDVPKIRAELERALIAPQTETGGEIK